MTERRMLVVYYSRTGTTKALAGRLADLLTADCEEIVERRVRSGLFGWVGASVDAMLDREADILAGTLDPASYEVVVLGTPVWNASVATPMRAWLRRHSGRLRKVAFFCTHSGHGSAGALRELEARCGVAPALSLVLRSSELGHDTFERKARTFADALSGARAKSIAPSSAVSAPRLASGRPHSGVSEVADEKSRVA